MGAVHQEVGQEADYSATREALSSMIGNLGKPRRKRIPPPGGIVVAGGTNHGQIAHTIIIQAPARDGPCIDDAQQAELVCRLKAVGDPQALLGVLLRVMGYASVSAIPAARWPEAMRWASELADLAATARMMAATGQQ